MNQKGFTLIEVMVSLGIYSIVLSGLIPSFVSYSKFITRSQIKTEAITAAQQVLDELRVSDIQSLPVSGNDDPETIVENKRTYKVVASYCENQEFCSHLARHIVVRVFYFDKQIIKLQTVYTQLRSK